MTVMTVVSTVTWLRSSWAVTAVAMAMAVSVSVSVTMTMSMSTTSDLRCTWFAGIVIWPLVLFNNGSAWHRDVKSMKTYASWDADTLLSVPEFVLLGAVRNTFL